jgi:hypothetical protein
MDCFIKTIHHWSAVPLKPPTFGPLPLIFFLNLHNWGISDDIWNNSSISGVLDTTSDHPPCSSQKIHNFIVQFTGDFESIFERARVPSGSDGVVWWKKTDVDNLVTGSFSGGSLIFLTKINTNYWFLGMGFLYMLHHIIGLASETETDF